MPRPASCSKSWAISTESVEALLVRVVLDTDFRALTLANPEAAFAGYDLSDAQKDAIRARGPALQQLLAEITHARHRTPSVRTLGKLSLGAAPVHAGPHIYIVGLGIRSVDQITRETASALRQCQEVLYVDTGLATGAFLETLCPRVTSLFGALYVDDASRVDTYVQMADKVIAAALATPPVAFAMQGHPIVYALTPSLIRDRARQRGLRVQVLPGISSMDCLFADLMLDPSTQGLQLYEATDLLLRKRPLQPDVPALIWQVGNLETRLHSARPSKPARLARFVAHLRQFYPEDHPVTAYWACNHPLLTDTQQVLPLAELAERAAFLHPGITLYLPPVGTRPIADTTLLAQLDDPAHLARITED